MKRLLKRIRTFYNTIRIRIAEKTWNGVKYVYYPSGGVKLFLFVSLLFLLLIYDFIIILGALKTYQLTDCISMIYGDIEEATILWRKDCLIHLATHVC